MTFRVSVVVATFNRGPSLADLLRDLTSQDVPADDFELVIIDDGSKVPAEEAIRDIDTPYKVTLRRQENTGQSGARQHGIELAVGEIIIIVDDDMQLPTDFIRSHLGHHDDGADVVLGHIRPPKNTDNMPLFERFHLWQLDNWVQSFENGTRQVRGVHLCTGNVSFSREAFFEVGGFDTSLKRSEDRDLGLRFEAAGKKLVFAKNAVSIHHTDHVDGKQWLRRAYLYGIHDSKIAEKHPGKEIASPWRLMGLSHPAARPLLMASVISPGLGRRLRNIGMRASRVLDEVGFESIALRGCTVSYNLEYFRGVSQAAGSRRQLTKEFFEYLLNQED